MLKNGGQTGVLKKNKMKTEVVVIGAGMSGLSAALTLKKRGYEVKLLEPAGRPGGAAQTFFENGYLCESGPNTMMVSRSETVAFLEENGMMDSALDAAPQAKRRYVVRDGKPVVLPNSLQSFISGSFLSASGKLAMMAEPLRSKGRNANESLGDFFSRRIGAEAAVELVDPFVSGIYAGDPSRLVMRHAMPKLYEWEQLGGSLLRGMILSKKKAGGGTDKKIKRRLISWPGGLSELSSGLLARLGQGLKLSEEARAIRPQNGGFLIETAAGVYEAKQVVLATSAKQAAALIAPFAGAVGALQNVPYAPMLVAHIGYDRNAVSHPLDGFGMLVSRARGIRTLGALFSSTLFPGRAPVGKVLLTAFIGGRRDQAALALEENEVREVILKDMKPLLGISSSPEFFRLTKWERAIPQYEAGHECMLDECARIENAFPSLHLIGNYRGGISMEDCIGSARSMAEKI